MDIPSFATQRNFALSEYISWNFLDAIEARLHPQVIRIALDLIETYPHHGGYWERTAQKALDAAFAIKDHRYIIQISEMIGNNPSFSKESGYWRNTMSKAYDSAKEIKDYDAAVRIAGSLASTYYKEGSDYKIWKEQAERYY